jgi:hypothetical protein
MMNVRTPAHCFFLLCCLLLFGYVNAQRLELIKTTRFPWATALEADPLGNYYVLNESTILKFNLSDTLFSRYSELRYGPIKTLDVSNPMKITLFYETFSQVIFLDNTLNPTFTSTNLYDLDMQNASAVCSSFDNGFWIFNQPDFTLVRINAYGEPDRRIKNLNLITGKELKPTRMLEKENRLFMYDPLLGIFQFDIFGGFLNRIPLIGFDSFSVWNRQIFYTRTDSLFSLDLLTMKEQAAPLPLQNIRCVRVEKNRLYVLTREGQLSVFSFSEKR